MTTKRLNFIQQQTCKPGSVPPGLKPAVSIINLDRPLLCGSSNLPVPASTSRAACRTETSSFASGTYLVFQLLRFTAIPVTRKSREPLPHVFTLTRAGKPASGGIFSVALAVAGCRRLPVRKQDALRCPDFPPPLRLVWHSSSDRTFCRYKDKASVKL